MLRGTRSKCCPWVFPQGRNPKDWDLDDVVPQPLPAGFFDSAAPAQVMNDEMARKYLTSFKRLMKVAQDARPDVAPSKKVM